ncbi:hypothetical protein BX265_0200 [Streptomyces sp. TLI_235]|nr:hypothetical protein [Streptomyces sp. TLI_235]PBC75532.1 hypothetical protein BX265_0200 [Streptomyces sp. TLI_235]
MTPTTSPEPQSALRPHEEISAALALAATDRLSAGRYGRGVIGALRWATGGRVTAPITASAPMDAGRPCALRVAEEYRAARGELLGHAGRTVELDFARGVHDTLAWVCGGPDGPPTLTGR